MSKFNAAKQPVSKPSPSITPQPNAVNTAGGEAFKQPLKLELASVVLTSMLGNQYGTSADDKQTHITDLVDRVVKAGHGEFCAKAAVFARTVHGLRSISHLIAGVLGDRCHGATWRKPFYNSVIVRPDDMTEILSLWNAQHPKKRHPNAMTRGFGLAMKRFDAYQLAKYLGNGKSVNMYDVANVCHPVGGATGPITDLVKGKLKPADTWERALSKAGEAAQEGENVGEVKAAEWERLLAEKKLGYLACLRNMRNILEQAPNAVDAACAVLTDEKGVRNCKVFPFQFKNAYNAVKDSTEAGARKVRAAISKAIDLSVANVPKFTGTTLVVVDDSGSMTSGGSEKCPIEIAALFAAVIMKANPDADYMQFADNARYVPIDFDNMGTMACAEAIVKSASSGGTNFSSIFQVAKKPYDRIIILSDMQGWMEGGARGANAGYETFKRARSCDPFLYSFDLTGNGTSQFPTSKVAALAGWSDKVFDLMKVVETDRHALVAAIEAIKL